MSLQVPSEFREFPGFANVYEGLGEADVVNGISRRQFIALSAAALGLSGLAGCRRPDLQILPYSKAPDNVTPGLPTFYATAIPRVGHCFPVLVESHEGRPTKIEGHPKHPASLGATDTHAQASVLDVYSPDRSTQVLNKGEAKKWDDFDSFATGHFLALAKEQGKGLRFLAEDWNSPAIRVVREHIKSILPEAVWHVYEPVNLDNIKQGSQAAYGQSLNVDYHFEKANCILALDCDFLGLDHNSVINSRRFAERRRVPDDAIVEQHKFYLNRLYVVENTYTITGTMADHRLRLANSQILDYLILLAKKLITEFPNASSSIKDGINKLLKPTLDIPEVWIDEVAADLLAKRGKGIILAGYKQPPLAHLLVHLLNYLLGNNGSTIEFRPASTEENQDLISLVEAIKKEEVKTLVILGGNPTFTAPADLKLSDTLTKVPTVIRLGINVDETSAGATWHLPMAHYLESWGDGETVTGIYTSIQPLIAPLHGGRSALELLIQISNYESASTYPLAKNKVLDVIKKAFVAKGGKEEAFKQFIQEGFLPSSEPKPIELKLVETSITEWLSKKYLPADVSEANPEVVFHADYSLLDGRFATNGWLMEWPDPISKLVWDNAAYISKKMAEKLGVTKNGQFISILVKDRDIQIPAFILPGQADFSVSVMLGYGKKDGPGLRMAHIPEGGGFNVYPIRTSENLHVCSAMVQKLKRMDMDKFVTEVPEDYDLVMTQEWGTIPEGREPIAQQISFEEYSEHLHEKKVHHQDHEHPKHHEENPKEKFQYGYDASKQKNPKERIRLDLAYPAPLDAHHQWGMVIDLNSCTGCSVCVIACQSENNTPIVSKGEVKLNREMHWIRMDRYFTEKEANVEAGVESKPLDETGIIHQPVMCVHCEGAPCETVCPVNATVHSPEGLNLQVYNRCIGTRYCSNACPYKARRFNWFDFNQRKLDELRVPTPFSEKGMQETLKMQKNPDVTVRSRGVMEKCTYCIQRTERAKIGAKLLAAKANYAIPQDPKLAGYNILQIDGEKRVQVPDGVVTPACAQACPSQAIVFGNLRDETSRVYKLKQRESDYLLLGWLNTKPRTSYLPRLKNPNPKMSKEATA